MFPYRVRPQSGNDFGQGQLPKLLHVCSVDQALCGVKDMILHNKEAKKREDNKDSEKSQSTKIMNLKHLGKTHTLKLICSSVTQFLWQVQGLPGVLNSLIIRNTKFVFIVYYQSFHVVITKSFKFGLGGKVDLLVKTNRQVVPSPYISLLVFRKFLEKDCLYLMTRQWDSISYFSRL